MCTYADEKLYCEDKNCKYRLRTQPKDSNAPRKKSIHFAVRNDVLWQPCKAKADWAAAQEPKVYLTVDDGSFRGNEYACQPGQATYHKERKYRLTNATPCPTCAAGMGPVPS